MSKNHTFQISKNYKLTQTFNKLYSPIPFNKKSQSKKKYTLNYKINNKSTIKFIFHNKKKLKINKKKINIIINKFKKSNKNTINKLTQKFLTSIKKKKIKTLFPISLKLHLKLKKSKKKYQTTNINNNLSNHIIKNYSNLNKIIKQILKNFFNLIPKNTNKNLILFSKFIKQKTKPKSTIIPILINYNTK